MFASVITVPLRPYGNDIIVLHSVTISRHRATQHLAAIVAETGEPIDVIATPDPDQALDHVLNVVEDMLSISERNDLAIAVFPRPYSIALRRGGINAFPILETYSQIAKAFPSGTAPVLEVVLKSMPIPDDETPWEAIIEFRNDPESMKRLRRLHVWVRKIRQRCHRNVKA